MLLRLLGATALAVHAASAFRDASPFFFSSTSELSAPSKIGSNVASANDVQSSVMGMLKDCPSDTYIIVEEAGVSLADFASSNSKAANLRKLMSGENKSIKSTMTVANVVGSFAEELSQSIQSQCGASQVTVDGSNGELPTGSTPQVISIKYRQATSGHGVAHSLSTHDTYLAAVISSLSTNKYTVMYTTSPPSNADYQQVDNQEQVYEYDEPYPSSLHTDLKRDTNAYPRASNSSNLNSDLPLFEKYQFLNAGIFMGLLVTIVLLMILYVGISAISGLEVSYGAFSKEMGPAAQRKQQQ